MLRLVASLLITLIAATSAYAQTSPCNQDAQMVVSVGPNDLMKFSMESPDHTVIKDNLPVVVNYKFQIKNAATTQGVTLATFVIPKEQMTLALGTADCYSTQPIPVPQSLDSLRDGKTMLVVIGQTSNQQFDSDEMVSNPFTLALSQVVLPKPRAGALRVNTVSVTSVTRPSR